MVRSIEMACHPWGRWSSFLFVGIVFSWLYRAGVEMEKRGRNVIAPRPAQ